jgi:glycosyltransferase involved in cell wall biosynthesis
MDNRKVSVVIPTYNRAYCLGATIGSLQAQTYPHWEALVIDDGSSDGTAELMRSLSAADPRVKYFPQKNAGVSAARNAGLRLVDGEWAAFLDSDDAWEPWKLAAQIACFDRLPEVGMVWTDMNAFDADGKLVSPRHLRKMYAAYERVGDIQMFQGEQKLSDLAPDLAGMHEELAGAVVHWGEIYSWMMYGNVVHTSTVLLRKDRLRKVGFFEESYKTGEDHDFHMRTCLEGPVALLDAPCIRYRIAGGADQLTSPKHQLEIARNGLLIREAALARHRARIALSDAQIGKIMARANGWVAHELFEQGNFGEARRYFRRAGLLEDPAPATLLKASIAHLPPAIAGSVMALVRKAQGKSNAKPKTKATTTA